MTRLLNHHRIAALLLTLFAFAASLVINSTVFERLPHLEDEIAYVFQAKIFARGYAWVPRQEPVKVFWQPFVIQPEKPTDGVLKRFGKYTPGWPLLLAPGAAIDTPWIMNAFFGMLCVALTYRLGAEVFDKTVGLVGALLLAISPMALLLNATLMSHPSAMFLTILFLYSYWRTIRHGRYRFAWAVTGGLALGMLVASRPLTAAAMALPVALHGLGRLLDMAGLVALRPRVRHKLLPLIVMALATIPFASLWPIYNQVWTGNWRTNVYTLQWSYDKVGFGIGYGPNKQEGHQLWKGWRNTRTDLGVYFRDLFGFTLNPTLGNYAATNWGYGAGLGLSYIPILAGLIAGRRKEWIWLLFELFLTLVLAQLAYWIGSTVNGAAAYSLRYYYEPTFAMALIGGYGMVAWARSLQGRKAAAPTHIDHIPLATALPAAQADQWGSVVPIRFLNDATDVQLSVLDQPTFIGRLSKAWHSWWPLYFLLLVACGLSLAGYTPERFREPLPPDWPDGLYGYNMIGQYQLDNIQVMRELSGTPTKPVLIIVLDSPIAAEKDNWRNYGAAMAKTSPLLDSDIIVARVMDKVDVLQYVRRFPGRLVLYQIMDRLYFSAEEAIADSIQLHQQSAP